MPHEPRPEDSHAVLADEVQRCRWALRRIDEALAEGQREVLRWEAAGTRWHAMAVLLERVEVARDVVAEALEPFTVPKESE